MAFGLAIGIIMIWALTGPLFRREGHQDAAVVSNESASGVGH